MKYLFPHVIRRKFTCIVSGRHPNMASNVFRIGKEMQPNPPPTLIDNNGKWDMVLWNSTAPRAYIVSVFWI
jgi:hypothetical protein